ncbi:MAG: HlyD family efflux transporter periplasmic adaptor subunit [Selenomonas sp.]|uniref:HlyD family secretion protein n=1 Tax=Selenomonas sp. TaxID=2053611 RepID=UPI0025E6F19A|nr:HlyD family efflux transporter periplasmic adaptor subunit [Selenomonas sp.]MCR5758230.1 HlyD family efflux transporter periplasmic adaptor subunit [Selenomonas sp.]
MGKQLRRYRREWKLMVFALVILTGLGIFFWQSNKAKADTPGNWGMSDAKESNVNSKIAGRVVELCVQEGDYVEKGQVLARIDTDSLEPQQRQSQAALAAQYAQLRQVMISSAGTAGQLEAALQAAEAKKVQADSARKLAAKDASRYQQLLTANAVSAQTYDTYKTQLEQADALCRAAESEVESARAALLNNQANQAAQEAAQKQADALQGQLDSVEVNLGETEIRAPYAGIITQKYVEEGDLISTSVPLYAIQDPRDNWVDFKIKETELNKFHVGDSVALLGRDNKTRITGTVESIRRKADFAVQKATSERGDTDVMAFNVKVRLNDDTVWPGMRFRLAE